MIKYCINFEIRFIIWEGIFNLWRTLKQGAVCEVIFDQPIAVMQQLDAGEIEANGKLGGLGTVTTNSYDIYVSRKGQQTKMSTLKLTMSKE